MVKMKTLKFIMIFALFPILIFCYEFQLCLTAIFQNEAPYLVEWIEYHKERGVEYFRLYNNNSTDNFREVLKPYIESGLVKIVEWPSIQQENDIAHHTFEVQIGAYNEAISYFRHRTKWLAIIDTDEFIFPVIENTIPDLLEKHYPMVSGLCINWQDFGTSGVERGEMIDGNVFILGSLIWKAEENYFHNGFCKSIVRPKYVSHCPSPHYCDFRLGKYSVNTQFQPVKGHSFPVDLSKIRINHYWSRDEWFYRNVKIPRYVRWGHNPEEPIKMYSEINSVEDREIQRFLPLNYQK